MRCGQAGDKHRQFAGGLVIKFRTEIEGLRAAAVLPILFFHAGIDRFAGGFFGVDVFFVISGFLITSIIAGEMAGERFTIAKFYKRRALRLFPALFVVLAATLICAGLTLFPSEIRAVSLSTGATALFVSNVYFWFTSGYFTAAAVSKPLLHTWSLGVEEQFYLFYPLLLLLVRRWRAAMLVPVIAAVTLASLALSIVTSLNPAWADFAFYMLPSRAWQLGLGALIALGAVPQVSNRAVREVAVLAGLAMIAGSMFIIPMGLGFPAPWALLPCIGAAIVLAWGEASLGGWALSLAPMRFIGRISYSVYLWHWPIITFYRLQTDFPLSNTESVALVVVTLAVGAASYFLIERPFLSRFKATPERRVLAVGIAALGVIVAGSALLHATADRVRTFPEAALKVARYGDYYLGPQFDAQFRYRQCFVERQMKFDRAACFRIAPDRHNVVVAGDSHAAHLWRALAERFPGDQVSQITAAGCRPLRHATGQPHCVALMDWLFERLVPKGEIETVVLSGNWGEDELDALVATITYLRDNGVEVIVAGPSLEYTQELPMVLSRAILRGDPGSVSQYQKPGIKELSDAMGARVTAAGARYVPLFDLQCPGGVCAPRDAKGNPVLFDADHLTPSAAGALAGAFVPPRHR